MARPRGIYAVLEAPERSLVTHYGEAYNGHTLGCGYGVYSSGDPTIVAVGPADAREMPCGTLLQICGPGGCQVAARKDACPGCSQGVFDLSEAGIARVCGPATGVCSVTVARIAVCENLSFAMQRPPLATAEDALRSALSPEKTAFVPDALRTPAEAASPVCVVEGAAAS